MDESAESASRLLGEAFSGADQQVRESLLRVGQQMEESLASAHEKLSSTLEGTSKDLVALSEAQEKQLQGWTEIVGTLTPALANLRTSATDLNTLVQDLQQAMIPAATTASDFQSAATQITSVFPSIEVTADSYEKIQSISTGGCAIFGQFDLVL